MSGFAVIFDSQEPPTTQDGSFQAFQASVAHYKELHSACHQASGRLCAAVKFDTLSTLHHGIVVDEQSGSWLLAAGTVLDSENRRNEGQLKTLLTNYLSRGHAALQSLDGPFALVIYNRTTDTLAVVSDPFGFVSVFYAQRGSRVYVATSALAVAQAVQATPGEYGIYTFLTTGCVFGRSTLWQEVERLSAGTVLEISSKGRTESVYWQPTIKHEIAQLTLNETVDYAVDLISHSIKRYIEDERKVWVDLTGGFDSRLVAGTMNHCGLPFKASCAGSFGSPDVRISSGIAQQLGWEYQHTILPEDWGRRRYEWLSRALGKVDGHLDLLKSCGVVWDQEQRAREYPVSIWGLGGELWRGTIWKQEFWKAGRTTVVNYDRLVDYRELHAGDYGLFADASRLKWIRGELVALFRSVGEQYADLPNTFKLDRIFAYDATGHTGAHTSAVMGQQRVISPLYFKESITGVISTHYKWRQHSRLVRLMLDKINPALASFETTSGGPALPMRIGNLAKFIPYWSLVGQQFLRKTSRAVLGREVFSRSDNRPRLYPQRYPFPQWRRETLDCLAADKMLDHAHMHSGKLYHSGRLADLISRAYADDFDQEAFLSRILTVEMALRSTGASL